MASPTTTPSRRTLVTGLAAGSRVCSLMIWNTRSSGWPMASLRFPSGHGFCDGIQKCDSPFGVSGDHAVANAGQCDPKKLALLGQLCRFAFQRLFCRHKFPLRAFPRQQNGPGVLQRHRTYQLFFVIVGYASAVSQNLFGEQSALNPRANFQQTLFRVSWMCRH